MLTLGSADLRRNGVDSWSEGDVRDLSLGGEEAVEPVVHGDAALGHEAHRERVVPHAAVVKTTPD